MCRGGKGRIDVTLQPRLTVWQFKPGDEIPEFLPGAQPALLQCLHQSYIKWRVTIHREESSPVPFGKSPLAEYDPCPPPPFPQAAGCILRCHIKIELLTMVNE